MAKRHYTVSQKRHQKRGTYSHSQKFIEKQRQIDMYIETRRRLQERGVRFEGEFRTRPEISRALKAYDAKGYELALEQLSTSPKQAKAAYDIARKILDAAPKDSKGNITVQEIAAFDKITVMDFLTYTEKAEKFWEYVRNHGGEFKELAEY